MLAKWKEYRIIKKSGLFDPAYYLLNNPDVRNADVDPLSHFIKQGWKEGRQPSAIFDTNFYLQKNPDVNHSGINPLIHYLKHGKKEGRAAKQIDQIAKTENANLFAASFEANNSTPIITPDRIESSKQLLDKLQQYLKYNDYIISISHDTYINNIGGVQLMVSSEQSAANAHGISYLHLHPNTFKPTLVLENGSFYISVNCDGKNIGIIDDEGLLAALKQLKPRKLMDVYIHHTMGFYLNVIYRILNEIGDVKGRFWLHDNFSICPSFYLLRNDVEYCGGPDIDSNACLICRYGEIRRKQQSAFKEFFSETHMEVRAPSSFTLELWKEKVLPERLSGIVVPLLELKWTGKMLPRNKKDPVRIGFVGFPVNHKGWPAWLRLMEKNANDERYKYYHLSSSYGNSDECTWINVAVSEKDRLAMVKALQNNKIDIAFLWSLCPESFSFTLHESLAAGCYLITNKNSGNIQDYLKKNPARGLVLDNEQDLFKLFSGDELISYVNTYQKNGKPQAELIFFNEFEESEN